MRLDLLFISKSSFYTVSVVIVIIILNLGPQDDSFVYRFSVINNGMITYRYENRLAHLLDGDSVISQLKNTLISYANRSQDVFFFMKNINFTSIFYIMMSTCCMFLFFFFHLHSPVSLANTFILYSNKDTKYSIVKSLLKILF